MMSCLPWLVLFLFCFMTVRALRSSVWQSRFGYGRLAQSRAVSTAAHIDTCLVPAFRLENIKDVYGRAKEFSLTTLGGLDAVHMCASTTLAFQQVNPPSSGSVDDSKMSFAGISLVSECAEELTENLLKTGCTVRLPLDNYKFGASSTPMEDDMKTTPTRHAVLVDENGYLIEVVDKLAQTTVVPTRKLILYVEDLHESVDFYTKTLGMTLYRFRSNVNSTPKDASMIAIVGYGEETEGVKLELRYRYATDKITHWPWPCQLHVRVPDLQATLDTAKAVNKGVEVLADGSFSMLDPSGYQVHVKPVNGV